MNLWLDDVREPWKFGCVGWTWVKTAQEAISLLKSGEVERASLDHDLEPEHYPSDVPEGMSWEESGNYNIWKMTGTGYDVCLWLESNPEFYPVGGVRVHSANPVGAARMRKMLYEIERRLAT